MTVSAILKSKGGDVIAVKPGDTLSTVVQVLTSKRIGAVLVLDQDRVVGVLSERDVVRAIGKKGAAALDVTAGEVMTAEVIHARPSDTVEHVMETMTRGRFRHVPIIEDGKLIGLVSIGDVVKRRIDDAVHEAEALKEYVATAG